MVTRAFRPDERLRTKFFLYIAVTFVILFLPWFLLALIPGAGWAFVAIYFAVNVIWIAISAVLVPPYFASIAYELREDDLVVRKGIITRTVQTVPYRTITNVEVKRGPLDRLLGIGGIHVHTAGYSQQASAEASLGGLVDYEAVVEALQAALRRYRARAVEGALPEQEPAASGARLDDVLAELRRIRTALERQGTSGPGA